MRYWPARRWAAAMIFTAVAAVAMGIPTDIVPTPLYHRMTAILWWNYPVWAASALLIGLTGATYVARRPLQPATQLAGGLASTLAVGCPLCNKLVVAALGISGASHVWAPIQPWLGMGSVGLLGYALRRRLSGERTCAVPATTNEAAAA